MRNARLDEAEAGIKIARRNINNLRYADDTTHLGHHRALSRVPCAVWQVLINYLFYT